ncbi:MAG: FtsW/RodA/SpoVE family cell cycle protein [Oscillospiraceae bacterium]|nr:FtsW/RodA/SpoVE family cell cycle protein [Oscillospiraceae bacterium]
MLKVIKNFFNYLSFGDKFLWTIIAIISSYSLLLIKSVSRERTSFFILQFIAVVAGFICAIVLQSLNYQALAGKYKIIFALCVLLMIYTLIFGITVEGLSGINARAWIKLPGGITFQPSELVKIGFIITFSKHISNLKNKGKINEFKSIVFLCLHVLVPVILTHMQGDDGAAVIFLCIAMFIAFIAGIKIRYFVSAIILGVASVPLAWNYILADYQKQRILNQVNPEMDPLNMGYQQIQGKLSIGSGGISGCGLFKGERVANGVVPIQESDFIFSVAGEELGFIGCFLIIFLLFLLILKALIIAKKSCDDLGTYICFGLIGLVACQTIFNLGMCLSLLPVMGVTLPFFSSGGSSTACLYLGIGIIQNVYLTQNRAMPQNN